MMRVLIAPLWNWNKGNWQGEYRCYSSNRTFMELKLESGQDVSEEAAVLIAPLWNWNTHGRSRRRSTSPVLIAPLWNWNNPIMVLRFTFKSVLIAPLWNWNHHHPRPRNGGIRGSNRTFMELKYHRKCSEYKYASVLIAPLWNWNLDEERPHRLPGVF